MQLAHHSTETMSSTEEARKVVVSECAKLWQAIESKKESLLTKINQQAHAKLKTLTLHKDHFEMMSSCAAQLVAQSESLTKSHNVSCCAVLYCVTFENPEHKQSNKPLTCCCVIRCPTPS